MYTALLGSRLSGFKRKTGSKLPCLRFIPYTEFIEVQPNIRNQLTAWCKSFVFFDILEQVSNFGALSKCVPFHNDGGTSTNEFHNASKFCVSTRSVKIHFSQSNLIREEAASVV
jgi:hypothetical protein